MTLLQFMRGFITFFFTLFAIQTISKALLNDYTNEQIGAWLHSHVPYTSALIGSLIFNVVMFFVAKRGEKADS